MGKRPLNLPFLGLQALLILIDCIAVAYVSPILVSFGYSPMRIGRVMTLAALAATLARPVWGYLNDHFACARQVTLLATAAGISCYCLLVFGGDARPAVTAVAVMGLNVTIVCMMNFVDAWALRLISEGYVLNYGATRAGGSLSFALGAMVFGWAAARWGFRPGSVILWVLFILLAIVILHLPNPAPASAGRPAAVPGPSPVHRPACLRALGPPRPGVGGESAPAAGLFPVYAGLMRYRQFSFCAHSRFRRDGTACRRGAFCAGDLRTACDDWIHPPA